MTAITFDLRVGGGAAPLTGGVTFTPTRVRYDDTSVTLPSPQTIGLHNGKGTMTGVTPTPNSGAPSWAYRAEVINGATGERKSWLVTVPDVTTVAFDDLDRPVQVVSPTVNVQKIADDLDAANAAAQESFIAAAQDDGDLVLTRTNGQTVNVGRVRGEQGLPGVNAIPADEAVAAYTATNGTASRAAMVDLMQAVLSDLVLNVKTFGAKGDGTTDDTAAIQAAITAADPNGAAISFPPGVYAVAGTVALRSNLYLTGPGATIRKVGNGNYVVFLGSGGTTTGYGSGIHNLTVTNLAFTGDLDAGRSCGAFLLHRASSITIRDCTFTDCVINGHAVDLMGCENIIIDGCIFAGAKQAAGRSYVEAIQCDTSMRNGWGGDAANAASEIWDGTPTRNLTVRDCRFVGRGPYRAPCAVGSHSALEGAKYTGITITGCHIEGQPVADFSSYYGQLHFVNTQRVKISGNTFVSTGSEQQAAVRFYRGAGITAAADVAAETFTSYNPPVPVVPEDITVQDNTFIGFGYVGGDGHGLVEVLAWSTAYPAAGINITGNRYMCDPASPAPAAAVVAYASGAAITGNTVRGVKRGFYCYGGNGGTTITGNTIRGGVGADIGVLLASAQTATTVAGNTIRGFTTPVHENSGVTGNTIANNNTGS